MGVVVLGAGLRHGEVAKRYLALDFGAVLTISQSNTHNAFVLWRQLLPKIDKSFVFA